MKDFLIVMLALILPLEAQRQGLPPESFGTDTYSLKYKLGPIATKVAEATLSVEEATWQQEEAFLCHASIKTSNIFRLFMAEEYGGRTYMSALGLDPLYSNLPFHKNGMDSKFEFIYNKDREVVEWNIVNVKEDIHKEFPLDGYTMDLLAFSFYVRTLDPAEMTGSLQMNTMLGRELVPIRVSYFGEDPSYIKGRSAYHYIVYMTGRGMMENRSGDEVNIWVDSQSRKLLGLQIKLSTGSLVVKIQQ